MVFIPSSDAMSDNILRTSDEYPCFVIKQYTIELKHVTQLGRAPKHIEALQEQDLRLRICELNRQRKTLNLQTLQSLQCIEQPQAQPFASNALRMIKLNAKMRKPSSTSHSIYHWPRSVSCSS